MRAHQWLYESLIKTSGAAAPDDRAPAEGSAMNPANSSPVLSKIDRHGTLHLGVISAQHSTQSISSHICVNKNEMPTVSHIRVHDRTNKQANRI